MLFRLTARTYRELLQFILWLNLCGLCALTAFAQDEEILALNRTEQISKVFPDSAFSLLRSVYSRSLEKHDNLAIGICLQQMGKVCYHLGYFAKSLEFYQHADAQFRQLHNLSRIASNLNDMGMLSYYNKQLSLARKQYDEALSIYEQLKDADGLAETYGRIGHLYEKQRLYDSATHYQRFALAQFGALAQGAGIAKIFENIGSIYEDTEKFDSAFFYFRAALAMYDTVGEKVNSIEVLNNLGDIYRKTGHLQDALVKTRESLNLAIATNDLYQQGAAYRDLGKTWNLLHQNDSAYHYLELSRRATIDVYSKDINRQTALLNVIFDIDSKNQEITQLENAGKISSIITASISIFSILIFVVGWFAISRQRLKTKTQRLISEQNQQIYEVRTKMMEQELSNKARKENLLQFELEAKKNGLATHTLHVIQKNQLLDELAQKLTALARDDKRDHKRQLQQIILQIEHNFNHDQYWQEFHSTFEQLHNDFFTRLKARFPDLSGNDSRLIALIKMNLSSTDIATLLGISSDSLRVARYRLKKKLGLSQEDSLPGLIQTL